MCQELAGHFHISPCTRFTYPYMYCKPALRRRRRPVTTYRLSACRGWRTGKHARGSSIAPKQTGTYTLRRQPERPRLHWWRRSDRPVPGERAVSFPGTWRVVEKTDSNTIIPQQETIQGPGDLAQQQSSYLAPTRP